MTDTPKGVVGECSRFVIDDTSVPFTLHNIMTQDQSYTLSLWTKIEADDAGTESVDDTETDVSDETTDETEYSISVYGMSMRSTAQWNYHVCTLIAAGSNLDIYFNDVGVYYIYHPQLERGTKATDWSESPLDNEEKIAEAKDAANDAQKNIDELAIYLDTTIKQIVAGINGGTLLEQTENGWTMVADGGGNSTKEKLAALSDAVQNLDKFSNEEIAQLKGSLGELSSYIDFGSIDTTDENGNVIATKPYIQLGTINPDTNQFGEFSLRITDTVIEFMQFGESIAYISNQQLYIEKAVIKQELSVGGFILKQHGTRNNVGFLWRGVTS